MSSPSLVPKGRHPPKRFKEAFRELHRSDIDPRELIAFFPLLRPQSPVYTPVNRLDLAQLGKPIESIHAVICCSPQKTKTSLSCSG